MSPMSEAARAAASERMKAMLAKKRAAKADPALQEALAKAPIAGVITGNSGVYVTEIGHWPEKGVELNHIVVQVDWEKTPMPDAQQFYAHLKAEFEKAGKILNARSMATVSGYTCFMCHKHFNGNPGFTDHSYIDPATGLSPRVDCCGELCVIHYHKMRIDQNLARRLQQASDQRGE